MAGCWPTPLTAGWTGRTTPFSEDDPEEEEEEEEEPPPAPAAGVPAVEEEEEEEEAEAGVAEGVGGGMEAELRAARGGG